MEARDPQVPVPFCWDLGLHARSLGLSFLIHNRRSSPASLSLCDKRSQTCRGWCFCTESGSQMYFFGLHCALKYFELIAVNESLEELTFYKLQCLLSLEKVARWSYLRALTHCHLEPRGINHPLTWGCGSPGASPHPASSLRRAECETRVSFAHVPVPLPELGV